MYIIYKLYSNVCKLYICCQSMKYEQEEKNDLLFTHTFSTYLFSSYSVLALTYVEKRYLHGIIMWYLPCRGSEISEGDTNRSRPLQFAICYD